MGKHLPTPEAFQRPQARLHFLLLQALLSPESLMMNFINLSYPVCGGIIHLNIKTKFYVGVYSASAE